MSTIDSLWCRHGIPKSTGEAREVAVGFFRLRNESHLCRSCVALWCGAWAHRRLMYYTVVVLADYLSGQRIPPALNIYLVSCTTQREFLAVT